MKVNRIPIHGKTVAQPKHDLCATNIAEATTNES
jgi:hypothetical protein